MSTKLIPLIAIVVVALLSAGATQFISSWIHGPTDVAVTAPRDPVKPPVVKKGDTSVDVQKTYRTYVQFASLETKEAAFRFVADATRKYGSLLGDRRLQVYRVTIQGKVWYRVLLELQPKDATEVCRVAKAHGVDCLVITFAS